MSTYQEKTFESGVKLYVPEERSIQEPSLSLEQELDLYASEHVLHNGVLIHQDLADELQPSYLERAVSGPSLLKKIAAAAVGLGGMVAVALTPNYALGTTSTTPAKKCGAATAGSLVVLNGKKYSRSDLEKTAVKKVFIDDVSKTHKASSRASGADAGLRMTYNANRTRTGSYLNAIARKNLWESVKIIPVEGGYQACIDGYKAVPQFRTGLAGTFLSGHDIRKSKAGANGKCERHELLLNVEAGGLGTRGSNNNKQFKPGLNYFPAGFVCPEVDRKPWTVEFSGGLMHKFVGWTAAGEAYSPKDQYLLTLRSTYTLENSLLLGLEANFLSTDGETNQENTFNIPISSNAPVSGIELRGSNGFNRKVIGGGPGLVVGAQLRKDYRVNLAFSLGLLYRSQQDLLTEESQVFQDGTAMGEKKASTTPENREIWNFYVKAGISTRIPGNVPFVSNLTLNANAGVAFNDKEAFFLWQLGLGGTW